LWILTGAVVLTVAVVHWPVMSAQALSYDDDLYLLTNAYVQDPGLASTRFFFGELFYTTTLTGYSHPVALTSLMLDYAAGGRPDNLGPFHRTGLLLHLITTISVVMLVHLLFGGIWPAVLAGLVYGLHPLTVEPIAWLGQRKALIAGSFSIVCLGLYVWHVRRTRWWAYGTALVLYAAALLSKPTATPVIAVMVLLDYWPLNRINVKTLIEKLPFAAVAAVSTVITLISHAATAEVRLTDAGLWHKLLTVGHKLGFYYGKILWPTELSSYYPAPEPMALSNPPVLAGCAAAALVTMLLLVSLRWTRGPLIGWLIYFVALFPVLGFIGYSWVYAFDNYLYFPLVGLALLAGHLIHRCWNPSPGETRRLPASRVIIIGVVTAAAVLEARATRGHLQKWRDTDTLHSYMVELAPESAKPHFVRAYYLNYEGRREEAIAEFQETLRISPGDEGAHINLGFLLTAMDRLSQAEEHYRQAVRIAPDNVDALSGLADALYRLSRFEEAIPYYLQVISLRPGVAFYHNRAGMALAESARFDEAIAQYRAALLPEPDQPAVLQNLGRALLSRGQIDDALETWQKIIDAHPSHPTIPDLNQLMGDALLEEGRAVEAVLHYRAALKVRPDRLRLAYTLAWVLATDADPTVRNGAEAVGIAERVSEATRHSDPAVLDVLACAYAEAGRFEDAVRTAQKALTLARELGHDRLAEAVRQRLVLFEAGQPYHTGTPDGAP